MFTSEAVNCVGRLWMDFINITIIEIKQRLMDFKRWSWIKIVDF